jgi:hypothetical protein
MFILKKNRKYVKEKTSLTIILATKVKKIKVRSFKRFLSGEILTGLKYAQKT